MSEVDEMRALLYAAFGSKTSGQGGQGRPGVDGTTFFPEVSAEGILSWINNGGRPNPDPVNIKGEKGEDGKSAYEVAVENGFTGTEAEWLDSLKTDGGPDDYEFVTANDVESWFA